ARPWGGSGLAGRGSGGRASLSCAAARGAPLEGQRGEEGVDGEALVLAPPGCPAPDRLLAPRPRVAVEVFEGPAHAEIARRADVAPAEAAGEEPVRGPPAKPALPREPLDHGLARRRRERVEVEPARDDGPREVAAEDAADLRRDGRARRHVACARDAHR